MSSPDKRKKRPTSGTGPGPQVVSVSVHPGAKADRLGPYAGGVLRVTVKAKPEKGRANEALTALLAGALGIPRGNVSVLRGRTGRKKSLRIEGVGADELERFLASMEG